MFPGKPGNKKIKIMETDKGKIFLNTVFWGFILWLFGYVLGFVFFAFVPQEAIGWLIMPLGVIVTLWVLLKKIERDSFGCYVGLGVIWTIMAVALDYIFLVKLLNAADYYKFDVYLYYALIFFLPVVTGWYKSNKTKSIKK